MANARPQPHDRVEQANTCVPLEKLQSGAHIPRMATIVRCTNCGAEYRRTEEKFLVPHTGQANCTVCGDTLESWLENTHVAIFELVKRPDETPE